MSAEKENSEKPEFSLALKSLLSDLDTLGTVIESTPPKNNESAEELAVWRESAAISLQRLKDAVTTHRDVLSVTERAQAVFATSIFTGQDNFIDSRCRIFANECLGSFIPLDRTTASYLLLEHLKPIFQSAVHPGVRQDTGRAQNNPLDLQNMYDEQSWKIHGVGTWNTLAWVLSHLESDSIESLWPLVVPPLLTLMDDYEPAYKIKGVVVANALLRITPASLLRRTGIDELLFKALRNALQNLTSDQSPDLLRAATPCYLALASIVLPEDSTQRFDKISELVTDIIVPGWLYASSRIEVMVASTEVLLAVIQILGVGSARFLRVFIPQLTENLLPKEFSPVEPTLALRTTSAKCLLALMMNTRPRVPYWRHQILNAILRCWVDIFERPESGNELLKGTLLELFSELLVSSNSLLAKELSDLETLDVRMFSDLLELRMRCA